VRNKVVHSAPDRYQVAEASQNAARSADKLCKQLGYEFNESRLLRRALTHRSYTSEHNERLEFLGDSILGCVIAKHLYITYPHLSEGELSRLRSNLVREQTLVTLAQQLDLGSHLRLGEGEVKSGGFRRPSILADGMEALFGAVFMDRGFEAAQQVVLNIFMPYLEKLDVQNLGKDAKTLLQEHLQSKHLPLPCYSVIATHGEAHAQSFQVECVISSLNITAQGEGSSRRNAEQQAAQAACHELSL